MNFTGEAGDVSLEVVDIVLARGILSGRVDSHRLGTREEMRANRKPKYPGAG